MFKGRHPSRSFLCSFFGTGLLAMTEMNEDTRTAGNNRNIVVFASARTDPQMAERMSDIASQIEFERNDNASVIIDEDTFKKSRPELHFDEKSEAFAATLCERAEVWLLSPHEVEKLKCELCTLGTFEALHNEEMKKIEEIAKDYRKTLSERDNQLQHIQKEFQQSREENKELQEVLQQMCGGNNNFQEVLQQSCAKNKQVPESREEYKRLQEELQQSRAEYKELQEVFQRICEGNKHLEEELQKIRKENKWLEEFLISRAVRNRKSLRKTFSRAVRKTKSFWKIFFRAVRRT